MQSKFFFKKKYPVLSNHAMTSFSNNNISNKIKKNNGISKAN